MIHSTLSKTSVYIFHQYTYWIYYNFKKKTYHFPISSYRFCIYLYVQFSTHILCILIKIIILLFCRLILTLPKCCFRFMTGKKTQLSNSECIYKCACSAVSTDSFFYSLSLFHLMNLQADRERGLNFDAYVFFLPT